MKRHSILFVAACAPRVHAPRHGSFVHDMACALRSAGHEVAVLVPVRIFPDALLTHALLRPWQLRTLATQAKRWLSLWYGCRPQPFIRDGITYLYKRFTTTPHTSQAAANGKVLATSLDHWWPERAHHLVSKPDAVVGHFLETAPLVDTLGRALDATRAIYIHECPLGLSAPCRSKWVRQMVASLDLMLTNSEWNLGLLQDAGYMARRNGHAPLGVADNTPSTTGSQRCPESPLRLLYVARFAPNKRHLHIIEALRMMAGIHVTFLGDQGPMRAPVERYLDRHGLRGSFAVKSYRSKADLHSALASSDAFVSPSRYESFGMALLEAAAVGLPIIASSTSGFLQALVSDGFDMPTVTDCAGDELRQAVADLIQNYPQRKMLAERIRAHVMVRFTWSAFATTFGALLDQASSLKKEEEGGV